MRNLKKVIALVAVFAMLVSTVAFAQTYTDVTSEDNYYEAIEMLSSLDILTGDTDENGNAVFRPNDTITRAEVATIVERIQNVKTAAQTSTQFTDVPSSHWASGFVSLAAAQGIVNGYGDSTFGPEDPVLYEQAIKMVVETIGYGPFVEDNGGYYAGHLLAAQRYGLLDGVVGGTIGAEATRGQVAQLVYNAIDTPLMDRSTYGSAAEYIIYDGVNNTFMSLLTRDLGVAKGTGIVERNMVSSLTGFESIEVTKDEVTYINFNADNDYTNYDLADVESGTVYANGSNIGQYLGKEVTVYLQETGKSGDYNVISVAETNKNNSIEIDLADFVKLEDGKVEYYKDGARATTTQKLDSEYTILYNGVWVANVDEAEDVDDAEEVVADLTDEQTWSGRVTLIDNGSGTNYNIVSIEIATPAVVDEVSAAGKVTFKNDPISKDGKTIPALDFDPEIEDQLIILTKNGEEISYADLQEWDVLSILTNDSNEYYIAELIDSGKIEGEITEVSNSTTSAYENKKFKINGEYYDVAENYYENGRLTAGAAGNFYIDKYNKIVAYDKSGSAIASDNYAYILNTSAAQDDWEKQNVRVQYIDKNGAVGDVYLASTLRIENAGNVNVDVDETLADALGIEPDSDQIKLESLEVTDAEALAAAMKNQLVTYTVANTELTKITFAQDSEDESSLWATADATGVAYDEEEGYIRVGRKYDVTDDTIVFFINGTDPVYDTVEGEVNGTATKTASKIGGKASLSDDEYDYVQVFDGHDDVASVLVIYNTTGGISSSSNVAVIDTIGEATIDGTEVTSVTYWMNGEKLTAYTDVNYNGNIYTAKQGEIWKLAVVDSTITESRKLASYSRYADGEEQDNAGAVELTFTPANDKETIQFGPVVNYVNKSIRIAPVVRVDADEDGELDVVNAYTTATAYDFADYDAIKIEDATNIYVVDPARRTNNVYVGLAADAAYAKDLVEQAVSTTATVVDKATDTEWVGAGEDALGMMDFVAAISYDDEVQDVVIYKAIDFGRYTVE